jgi:hypothetical protein
VADRLGFAKPDSVLKLIARGDLPASNVSTGKRATWRIDAAALSDFLERRRAVPVVPRSTRRKRRPMLKAVTEYF